jgi:hypothetical protein
VDEPLDPRWMHSEFNQVYAVVAPVDDGKRYKVHFITKEGVPKVRRCSCLLRVDVGTR